MLTLFQRRSLKFTGIWRINLYQLYILDIQNLIFNNQETLFLNFILAFKFKLSICFSFVIKFMCGLAIAIFSKKWNKHTITNILSDQFTI